MGDTGDSPTPFGVAVSVDNNAEANIRIPPITIIVAGVTPVDDDFRSWFGDATAGPITFALPTAVGREGERYTFKKTDASANGILVLPFGGETIDGAASKTLANQNETFSIESDGVNWEVVVPLVSTAGGGGAVTLFSEAPGFSTASPVYVAIPGSAIPFVLAATTTIDFEGFATDGPDGVFVIDDAQLGIRVDGIDYPGSAGAFNNAGTAPFRTIVASKGLTLPAGPHVAELILRKPGLSPAVAAVTLGGPTFPTRLTLWTFPTGSGGGGGAALIDFTQYVSDVHGSDATGDGSITSPFKTIAAAFAAIPPHGNDYSKWAFERWTIHCEPGHYTEAGPIIFRQIRRSIRLYGDGAVIDAEVRFTQDIADWPDGVAFNPALVPAPWGPPDNVIPLSGFEIAGESGGMEGGIVANNIILRGRVLYRVEGDGPALAAVSPVFWFGRSFQSLAGWEFENASAPVGAPALTVELEQFSIINNHIGGDGVGGATFNLKAHNGQLRGTIGPFCNILEIDSCRIQAIDRTTDFAGGAVAGSVVGSTTTSQGAITDSYFNGATYNLGAAAGANVLTIDDVSLERLIAQGFTLTNIIFQPINRLLRQNRTLAVNTALLQTDKIVKGDASVGAITFTLPNPVLYILNTITIKKTDATANAITINPFAAETIDGAASASLSSPNESIDLYSDGVNWLSV